MCLNTNINNKNNNKSTQACPVLPLPRIESEVVYSKFQSPVVTGENNAFKYRGEIVR